MSGCGNDRCADIAYQLHNNCADPSGCAGDKNCLIFPDSCAFNKMLGSCSGQHERTGSIERKCLGELDEIMDRCNQVLGISAPRWASECAAGVADLLVATFALFAYSAECPRVDGYGVADFEFFGFTLYFLNHPHDFGSQHVRKFWDP